MNRWKQGDTVVVRNIARSDGSVTTAIPTIIVQDDHALFAVYIPKDTPFKNNWNIPSNQRVASVDSIIPSAQRLYKDLAWWHPTIRLYLPDYAYSIWLNFNDKWEFTSWYGNLEAPFIRTKVGIDTRDFALDIVATPDGQWAWKDEDEFNRRYEVGLDSATHQAHVRAAGQDFISRFERGAWPFNDGWEKWRPPEQWQTRELPKDWDVNLGTHDLLSTAVNQHT
ncbi:MAG: DUF402 domain-containing protein [Chloroflexi bacterium]|nr:DUF402 domain-containing protein [Chloroflexota bacterium]